MTAARPVFVALAGASALVGVLPLFAYYLHALFGLGGPRVAVGLVRRRKVLVAAALVLAMTSAVSTPVLAVVSGLLSIVSYAVLSWRAIDARFIPSTNVLETMAPVPDNTPVLFVARPPVGAPRAYALDWVAARHVLRDTSRNLLVTNCPLAQSSAAFVIRGGDDVRAIAPWAGHYLLGGDSGPVWSQVTGEVVVGAGEALAPVVLRLCTWGDAKVLGAVDVVAGPQPSAVPPASSAECVVAPAGMPVDEELVVVALASPPVAVPWSAVRDAVAPVEVRGVRVSRAMDGAVEVVDGSGGRVPVVLARASVADRLVASGLSKLTRA